MLEALIGRWKARFDAAVKSLVCAVVGLVAILLCLIFFGAAIFVWADDAYGTVPASLAFGAFFLAVAVAALATLRTLRRKAEALQRAAKPQPWWLDPRVVAAGLQLWRSVGGRRGLSLGLVGAFLIGVLLSRGAGKSDDGKPDDK